MAKVETIISSTESELELACSECSKKLSEVDKEINDIYHYIEFNDLDAYRGWKAYKMLKDKLVERRGIKDDFELALRVKKGLKAKVKQINKERVTKKYKPKRMVIK